MSQRQKLQDLFYQKDEELRILQRALYQLEKEALSIGSHFQNLESKIDQMQNQISPKRHPRLFRRLSQLRFLLRQLEHRHGYKEEFFANLEKAISVARKKLPQEIIPFRLNFPEKAIIYPTVEKGKTPKIPLKESLCFYRLQNGSMFFIIPAQKLLFTATVPNKEKITLKLSRGTFVFSRLPGDDPLEEKAKNKKAFLFYYQNQYISLLADNYLGKLYLSLKLFRRKINYLKVAENWYEAFLHLGGKRYYLLKSYLTLLREHEKSLEILAP